MIGLLLSLLLVLAAITHPGWFLVVAYAVGIPAVLRFVWWMHTWPQHAWRQHDCDK